VTPTPPPNVTLPRRGAQPPALSATAVATPGASAEPALGLEPTSPNEQPTEGLTPVLDTQFFPPPEGWPNDPSGMAWFAAEGYYLFARFPSRFVAVGAPLQQTFSDVVVTARFRKVGGPPGGGYGVIVRDGESGERDGRNQLGHFYVAEVGDQGEMGIWRREGDHWLDLVPWTRSQSVQTGFAGNEVQLRATGQTLVLRINGVIAAQVEDDALLKGGVGLFVGGDGNQAIASSYRVEVPH
jgi:hypothetical protein